MPSLNEIVSSLAARVDKPFDVNLQEELKHIVEYKRANYTQQFIQKHPEQRKFFLQKFTVELEKAPEDDCEPVKGCTILRSKCEIPQPIRNSHVLFDFVGDSNFMRGYGYEDPAFIQDTKYNRFTPKRAKWYFMNNRLYIYNSTTIERVGVRGVFENPFDVAACACEKNCFDEDSAYPIATDLLNSIVRDILSVELRQPMPPAEEVEVDKLEEQENRGLQPNDKA